MITNENTRFTNPLMNEYMYGYLSIIARYTVNNNELECLKI